MIGMYFYIYKIKKLLQRQDEMKVGAIAVLLLFYLISFHLLFFFH
jgi:hypothetical protein